MAFQQSSDEKISPVEDKEPIKKSLVADFPDEDYDNYMRWFPEKDEPFTTVPPPSPAKLVEEDDYNDLVRQMYPELYKEPVVGTAAAAAIAATAASAADEEEDDDYDHLEFDEEEKIDKFQFQRFLVNNEKRFANLLHNFYEEFGDHNNYYHLVCDPGYLDDLVRTLTQSDLFVYPFINERTDSNNVVVYGNLIVRIPVTYHLTIEKILYNFKRCMLGLYKPRWFWESAFRKFTNAVDLIRFIVHLQTIEGLDSTGAFFYHCSHTDYFFFKNGIEVDAFLKKYFPKLLFGDYTLENGLVIETFPLNRNWKLIQSIFIG